MCILNGECLIHVLWSYANPRNSLGIEKALYNNLGQWNNSNNNT